MPSSSCSSSSARNPDQQRPLEPPIYLGAAGTSSVTANRSLADAVSDCSASESTYNSYRHKDASRSKHCSSVAQTKLEDGAELAQDPRIALQKNVDAATAGISRKISLPVPGAPPTADRTQSVARITSPSIPAGAAPLDLKLTLTATGDPSVVYIDWGPGDPDNPLNWSTSRKWAICSVCFTFAMLTAINATGYSATQEAITAEFGCSNEVFLIGNMTYFISIAFTPMVLAPLSESLGRQVIYLIAAVLYALLYIPQALAPNIVAIIVVRWFQGCCASVGNSMVGGSVSDVFPTVKRGLPLSVFCLLVYVGQSFSPTVSAYIVPSHLGWRFVFWWQSILGAVVFLAMLLLMRETRGTYLLSRRAKRLTKQSMHQYQQQEQSSGKADEESSRRPGYMTYRCRADDERGSFMTMARTSLSRPFVYLLTEPVCLVFSLWVAVAWGTVFLSLTSVPVAFREAYGFTNAQSSLVLLGIAPGSILGWALNFHQDRLYAKAAAKNGGKAPPEARLYYPCIGGLVFPAGLFMYAWGTRAGVHPSVGIIGFVIFNTGVYFVYVGVFSFLSDVYARYASSALAAQSWLRNVFAGFFPLFGVIMYERQAPPIATTIIASIGLALGIVPFALLKYGSRLRAVSRVAKQLAKEEEEAEEFMRHQREKEQRRAAKEQRRKALAAVATSGTIADTLKQPQRQQKVDLEKQ
ncbi:MFS general substrate transporter [Tilletiaria anomala UBC 951]|uniref:MFS general substrate transporter n=1 Tax=Tilletiaria anomala (strain ATCC 24038 / CBS 436.72 / UBC 951) TaxID=1037660 RepID=A0A066VC14_TILAU|nr:MFS general substrate transporter [Tilletiaria anomala UBC 951]KDN37818.1 MFS general substrate transporter [Tilletiaria anomala UBC 951]